MSESYTGVKVLQVKKEIINELYRNGEIEVWDKRYGWYENLYVVVKDESGGSQSALAKVRNGKLVLLNDGLSASGIEPRNKEQRMALDALLDDSIDVVALTGKAGVGKTLLAMAACLKLLDLKKYKKLVVSKNMVQVDERLGFLPGNMLEKFMPFNQGVLSNVEFLLKGDKSKVQDLIDQYKIEFLPLSVIRGSSWNDCIVVCDEAQNMNYHETLTLGTRISENSKLILLGDLKQIDGKLKKKTSGLDYFVNHEEVKASPFVAALELIKSERGHVAELFANIFESSDG